MRIFSGIFRVIIGAIFGLGCYIALAPAFATFMDTENSTAVLVLMWAMIGIGALIGLLSRSIRRTFGWGFLELGLCTLALPLSMMMLAGKVANDMTNAAEAGDKGTTLIGSGLAGGLMTGAAAIVGFFLGAIFLIIALILLLGGRREVILVDRATGVAVNGVAQIDTSARTRVAPPPLPDMSRWSKKDRERYMAQNAQRIEPN